MKKEKIAKIIFTKVLNMPLPKYLAYIEKTTNELTNPIVSEEFTKNKSFYSRIFINNGNLCYEILNRRLEKIYPIGNNTNLLHTLFSNSISKHTPPLRHSRLSGIDSGQAGMTFVGEAEQSSQPVNTNNKTVCSLKWINTRNRFSLHILKSLIHYQSEFWFSGKERDLKPLTLKQFLLLYPLQFLDQSRLSRLISNLSVMSPHNQIIKLSDLFISKRKRNSLLIKEIITNNESPLKDKDIQNILSQKGIHLSIRTICNCRRSANIPNYKERSSNHYEKYMNFNGYMMLLKKTFKKFQPNPGFMNSLFQQKSTTQTIEAMSYTSVHQKT